jgi:hypothetical protein
LTHRTQWLAVYFGLQPSQSVQGQFRPKFRASLYFKWISIIFREQRQKLKCCPPAIGLRLRDPAFQRRFALSLLAIIAYFPA